MDDPLLSVHDLARLWGTGVTAVVQAVESGRVPSLDRGVLVAEGRYDVPLIRRSWAEALQEESPGALRRLDPPEGEAVHPAVRVAFEFHSALGEDDADRLFAASSSKSRGGRSPGELLAAWKAVGSHLLREDAGVGTAIYSLAPIEAVAARIFADAPKLPRALPRATPATLIDLLPLVRDEALWRVDLALFERRQELELTELLTSPPPSSDVSEGPPTSSS